MLKFDPFGFVPDIFTDPYFPEMEGPFLGDYMKDIVNELRKTREDSYRVKIMTFIILIVSILSFVLSVIALVRTWIA